MYALVAVGDKQYRMDKGETVLVDRVERDPGCIVTFDRVLLVRGDTDVKVGKPLVEGASVQCKVLGEEKGQKIKVETFKRRKGQKKIIGHRQKYTRVRVDEIVC